MTQIVKLQEFMIQNKSSDFMKNLILKIVKKLRSFTKFENNLRKTVKLFALLYNHKILSLKYLKSCLFVFFYEKSVSKKKKLFDSDDF